MIWKAKELEKFSIRASDGEIGKVRDFYLEELHWKVRYLVVDAGGWLVDRKVLIAPQTVLTPAGKDKTLPVKLTREQVRHSPPIDMAKPVSRQNEEKLRLHYGWEPYWTAIYASDEELAAIPDGGDPHLRSASEIIGDRIETRDGSIGHVEDLLIEDGTWAIRYFIVDTRNWWPGKKVLLSPWWVTEIDWARSTVSLELTRDQVKTSPEYDPLLPVDPSYLTRLHGHYRKPAPAEEHRRRT